MGLKGPPALGQGRYLFPGDDGAFLATLSISKEDVEAVKRTNRLITPSIAVCLLYFFMEDDKSPHLTCISLEIHRTSGMIIADQLPVPLDEIMSRYSPSRGVYGIQQPSRHFFHTERPWHRYPIREDRENTDKRPQVKFHSTLVG